MSEAIPGYSRRPFNGQIVLAIVGMAAGLLSWLIAEPFASTVETQGTRAGSILFTYGSVFGWVNTAVEGALLGGSLAVVLSLQRTSVSRALLAGLLAALLGGILVCATDNLLDVFFLGQLRGGTSRFALFEYLCYALLDALALALAIGLAAQPTLPRLTRALFAGTIGGFTDLVLRLVIQPIFVIVWTIFSHESRIHSYIPFDPSRLAEHVGLGLVLGIVLPLADRWLTTGNLQLCVGRNEFRTFPLFKSLARVGSAEGCEVPLFGFPGVAPVHATITHDGQRFLVQDGGSPNGTLVNGARVSQACLNHGDHIVVGSVELVFGASRSNAPYTPFYPVASPDFSVAPQYAPASSPPWQPEAAPTRNPTASPTMPRPRLIDEFGGEICLAPGVSSVGREPSMAICLPFDSRVSRRHAELAVDANGVTLRDLSSTNGTELNGTKITAPVTLKDRDVVRFGSTSMTFRDL